MARMKFGVFIPPRKKKPQQITLPMEFVLAGWIPSKKNMQIPTINKKHIISKLRAMRDTRTLTFKNIVKLITDSKSYIRNNDSYTKWVEQHTPELLFQVQMWRSTYEKHGLTFPISKCSVHIRYCWADKHRRDNSNKSEAIHDLLVSTGIIVDDSYTCLFKNSAEAECFKDEIVNHVTQVYVTAYQW